MLILSIVDTLFEVYYWILIIRFLSSWIPNLDYRHPIIKFVYNITDPLVRIFHGIIPPLGNVDFTPMILFLALRLVYPLIRRLLIQLIILF